MTTGDLPVESAVRSLMIPGTTPTIRHLIWGDHVRLPKTAHVEAAPAAVPQS